MALYLIAKLLVVKTQAKTSKNSSTKSGSLKEPLVGVSQELKCRSSDPT